MKPEDLRSRAAALDETSEDSPEPSSASKASGARLEKLRAMAKKKKQVCLFMPMYLLTPMKQAAYMQQISKDD